MKIRNSFKIIFVLFLSLLSYNTYGQIMKSVEFKINDIVRSSSTKNGTLYDCVGLKGVRMQRILGNPNLPVLHYRFYIPMNQKAVSVIFKSKKQDVIQLTNDLMPTQKPLLTTWDKQDTTFILPNKLVYGSNNVYPDMQARIADIDYLDGDLQLVNIEVYPMQYLPNSKKIVYNSQFDLQIQTVANDNADRKREHPKKRMREVMSVLKSLVVNPEMATFDSSSIVIKPSSSLSKVKAKVGSSTTITLPYYEYVIITDASLVSGFTDFVNWKKRKGINIGIVTTNDIYSNYTEDNISDPAITDNAGRVRQYLHDAHFDGTTTWALIAGDYNTNIPVKLSYYTYSEGKIPYDHYFSDLHSTSNFDPVSTPDIFVGRLICSNTTDIQNWSKKVLLYEQNPGNGDYSYLLKAFSIQADQGQRGIDPPNYSPPNQAGVVAPHFPSLTSTIWGETPSADAVYDSNGYSGATLGTTKGADVIGEMNNHYGLFSWFCHGNTVGGNSFIVSMSSGIIGSPYWGVFSQDANNAESNNGLDNLTSLSYPSLLYSVSCDNMPFDKTSNNNNGGVRNLGEAFTVLPQTGGVAFLGNTRYGYIDESLDIYINFADLINSDDYHSHLGVADCISRYTFGMDDGLLIYSHNLIGCPETQMWTATPTKFTLATISKSGSTVTVNTGGISNCRICVMSASDNGASYFSVDTLTSGKTFYNVPDSYYVTITKHNYIPYMYSSDYYMQNETYTGTQTINASNVIAGSNVTTSKPSGSVTIQSGANVTIDADGSTIINDSFEVQQGAQLEIK